MNAKPREISSPALEPQTSEYEAPRVEAVLSHEQIEREVLYAGNPAVVSR